MDVNQLYISQSLIVHFVVQLVNRVIFELFNSGVTSVQSEKPSTPYYNNQKF